MLSWKQAVARYQEPMLRKSIWQVVNTLIPYLSLSGLMIWTLHVSYWLTLAVAVAAAGFLTRIFIIFHDCGHGSFRSTRDSATCSDTLKSSCGPARLGRSLILTT